MFDKPFCNWSEIEWSRVRLDRWKRPIKFSKRTLKWESAAGDATRAPPNVANPFLCGISGRTTSCSDCSRRGSTRRTWCCTQPPASCSPGCVCAWRDWGRPSPPSPACSSRRTPSTPRRSVFAHYSLHPLQHPPPYVTLQLTPLSLSLSISPGFFVFIFSAINWHS